MQAKEGFYGRANDFDQITNITSPSSLRRTHAVTHHDLWYRYVPESGNWHGGTLTRWIAALSAAPLFLVSRELSQKGFQESDIVICIFN